MAKSIQDVLEWIKNDGVEYVDIRFIDVPGIQQHVSVPASVFSEDTFADGHGFDGSSIRGFQEINESDMILIPDPTTAHIDPYYERRTMVIFANVEDPITREKYSRDPRYVAQKAEAYLASTGVADTAYFGPEAEFFLFDSMRYDTSPQHSFFQIISREASWAAGDTELPGGGDLSFGYKVRTKGGYFPVPPTDQMQDVRSDMASTLMAMGVQIDLHHHEVASAGQGEIGIKFDTLTRIADKLLMYKYVVKNTAREYGLCATFMAKPLYGDNGTGMHCHQSLWRDGRNVFFDADGAYAGLSQTAMYYIGGILKHAPALLAFTNPTTNSYKRLVPGYEAPIMLAYSQRNRSAAVRIPMYNPNSASAKRIEFRTPDPTCNPYLAFAAQLMAGLDGIENQIDPGGPLDRNIYDLPPAERVNVPTLPTALDRVLDNLAADHDWLLKGGVFTEDLISSYIDFKMRNEFYEVNNRPHPAEFHLYFDI